MNYLRRFIFNKYAKRLHRWIIRRLEDRVTDLESRLAKARKDLTDAQDAYVRLFVTPVWRGRKYGE